MQQHHQQRQQQHNGWTKWQRVWILVALTIIVALLAAQLIKEGHF